MASTTLQYRVTANISAAASGFSQLAQRIEQSNKRINKSIDATFGKNAIRMSQNLLSSLKYAAAGLSALGVASVKMSAYRQRGDGSKTPQRFGAFRGHYAVRLLGARRRLEALAGLRLSGRGRHPDTAKRRRRFGCARPRAGRHRPHNACARPDGVKGQGLRRGNAPAH